MRHVPPASPIPTDPGPVSVSAVNERDDSPTKRFRGVDPKRPPGNLTDEEHALPIITYFI